MSRRKLKERCPCCGEYLYDKNGDIVCLGCGYEDMYYYIRQDKDCDDEDEVPSCCETCGGPYPLCKDSCNLFDT